MANPRVVVIGTGAGGLSAAACLARQGLEVIALEQAPEPGGLLGGFTRDGYGFDPGVHAVGSCGPGGLVRSILEPLGLDADELFVELDPDGFDAYRFPDLEVRMPRGLDALRERLVSAFPGSDLEICDYVSLVRAVRDVIHLGAGDREPGAITSALFNLPSIARRWRSSYADLLSSAIEDPRLRAVLAAPIGDEGLAPSQASAIGMLAHMAHYTDGSFYPRGGSARLRDALVASATAAGAIIRTGARVVEMHASLYRVVEIELENGDVLTADHVVSDVDPRVTFGWLDGAPRPPRRYAKRLDEIGSSLAPFVVFLGLRRDLRSHGLGRFNLWSYPSIDVEAAYAPVRDGLIPPDPMLLLSPASIKDDTGTLAPPGCTSLEVMTFVPYQHFAAAAAVEDGDRGGPYRDRKRRVEELILSTLDRRFPGMVGDVEVCVSSSPVDFQSRLGSVDGGAFGPAPAFWGPLRFETATWIPNLFLAGSGVLGHGVAPCLLSGRLAAQAVTQAAAKTG